MMMMMKMYFHFRIMESILFQQWMTSNMIEYVFSCIGVAAIAFVYEAVKFAGLIIRDMEKRDPGQGSYEIEQEAAQIENGTRVVVMRLNIFNGSLFPTSRKCLMLHTVDSAVHFVEMLLVYSLMMIAMTYNVPIVLSMLMGHIVAYFIITPIAPELSQDVAQEAGNCCS
ncbi:hypothetical protein WR25_15273 [Diploscapter pachys]|uniref:Copper transport protein n=1 Tax=Diploscapter pachys TaxID=2018661 RepID=A0A2A2KFG8_9BILA|nr:hypothetical protein WR25_15273 [Diploscapter pachys]